MTRNILLSTSLAVLLLMTGTEHTSAQSQTCNRDSNFKISLATDWKNTPCTKNSLSRSEQVACVWRKIEKKLEGCDGVDVYVPGTKDEDGDGFHFGAYEQREGVNARARINLQYNDSDKLKSAGIQYDRSVRQGIYALDLLLEALHENAQTDVHVFGHSKGSHIAAALSIYDRDHVRPVKFFAFGQPGRTRNSLTLLKSVMSNSNPARRNQRTLGTPGYVEKVNRNLVTITWENDEVKYVKGTGPANLAAPEVFAFPGLINQRGTYGNWSTKGRFDHHATYGADSRRKGYRYCAAGSKASWTADGYCSEKSHYHPAYFWGNQDCVDDAFYLMNGSAAVLGGRTKLYIGNSEPKPSGNCTQEYQARRQNYEVQLYDIKEVVLDYKAEIRDRHCKLKVEAEFLPPHAAVADYWQGNYRPGLSQRSITGYGGLSFEIDETDDEFETATKSNLKLPNHFILKLKVKLHKKSGGGKCKKEQDSKLWLRNMRVKFAKPGNRSEGDPRSHIYGTIVYIVRGEFEGTGYAKQITGRNNVAWQRKNNKTPRDKLKMYRRKEPDTSRKMIVIRGDSRQSYYGIFYKQVHLLD